MSKLQHSKNKTLLQWALCSAVISKANVTLPVSLCWHQCGFDRAYAVQQCLQCGIQGWLQPAGYQLCSSGLSTSEHWVSLRLGPPQNRSAPQGYQRQLTVTHSQSEKKLESFYILSCIYLGLPHIWFFSFYPLSPFPSQSLDLRDTYLKRNIWNSFTKLASASVLTVAVCNL